MESRSGDAAFSHPEPLPDGWALVDSYQGPSFVVLRFNRDGSTVHWVTSRGATYAEARASGVQRMRLYDTLE